MEYQVYISVTVEGSWLDVQQSDQILQLNKTFPLQIYLVFGESLHLQIVFVEFVSDWIWPVPVCLQVGFCHCLDGSIIALYCEEGVVFWLINFEGTLALFFWQVDSVLLEGWTQGDKFIFIVGGLEPYFKIPQILIKFGLLAEEMDKFL